MPIRNLPIANNSTVTAAAIEHAVDDVNQPIEVSVLAVGGQALGEVAVDDPLDGERTRGALRSVALAFADAAGRPRTERKATNHPFVLILPLSMRKCKMVLYECSNL